MLIPVILSGGSGTRLWPMSREYYPKQFHHLLGEYTLLQQTVQRLADIASPENTIVVGNIEHRFMITGQLAEIGWQSSTILLEPSGRNTAPAVAMAALSALEIDADAMLLVLAADHVIKDEGAFHETVANMRPLAEQGKLITFGIPATQPDTGFGYIRCGKKLAGGACVVDSFVEKPDRERAEQYVASGDYYWNSGMFMFSARAYLDELRRWQPDMYACCMSAWQSSEKYFDEYLVFNDEIFGQCPAMSIDYAVMEYTDRAIMAPLDAGWNDVGSWPALLSELETDESGNVKKGDVLVDNTSGCLLYAHDRLLATSGLKDIIAVETADAVLIAHRDSGSEVGEMAKRLRKGERSEASIHRRAFRPWGSYTVLEKNSHHQVKRLSLKPGAELSLQRHQHRAEHWVVVKGVATVVRGDSRMELGENESTFIPAGMVHQLANLTDEDIEIIEVQTGSYLEEDDIERLDDPYQRKGTSG